MQQERARTDRSDSGTIPRETRWMLMIRLVQMLGGKLRVGMVAIMLVVPAFVAACDGAAVQAQGVTASAGSGVLLGVSCTSAAMCIAVGSSSLGIHSHGLAETWNGKAWTITPTAHPTGAMDGNYFFYGVSCSSSHACMAVGEYEIPGGSLPLAEVWNGKTWRVTVTPQPSSDSGLGAVSCYSARWCMAVGHAISGSENNAFSEAWNGSRWTIERTLRPSGTTYSSLDRVSCAAASVCMAVGDYQAHGSADSLTLAEVWNGKQWSRRATPNPVSGANGSRLTGVSCRSADACVAVGAYSNVSNTGGHTLTETWNGKVWTMAAAGNDRAHPGRGLDGVSCPSRNACVAVGTETASSTGTTLAERWTGKQWTIQTTPNPGGATSSDLNGVSCDSPGACVAVGQYFTNSGRGGVPLPMSEVWNGTSWAIPTTPY